MDAFLEPLFAMLCIVAPLGLAYAIIGLQARNREKKSQRPQAQGSRFRN